VIQSKVDPEVTEPLAVASGTRTQNHNNAAATIEGIEYKANPDFSSSLCPARYRERFCTKRFVTSSN